MFVDALNVIQCMHDKSAYERLKMELHDRPGPPHQRVGVRMEHQLLQITDPLEVPALLAVKIRCLKQPTSSSAARQSAASHSIRTSAGPFTSAVTASVSNLSSGSGTSRSKGSSQTHLVHVSSLAGRALPSRIQPVIQETTGSPCCSSQFPAAFRPLAFASWTILSRWRSPPSLRSAYQVQHMPSWTPARVSAFHTGEIPTRSTTQPIGASRFRHYRG